MAAVVVRAWWRRRPSVPEPVAPVVVVSKVGSLSEDQDAALELLGVVMLGEPERVEEALLRVCRAAGTTVPFLVVLLVEQLRRDGYGPGVARLQEAALAAKARREQVR